ncbi:UNVERIFIED_CONTAM: hypothetical protein GTU68_059691 [Idotea baltica]|nr:hypothetical protein [Idotea baltica]
MRLDRLVGHLSGLGRNAVRDKLAARCVSVGGVTERNGQRDIGQFEIVALEGEILQNRTARYFMMNKPAGILSATSDPVHRTVIDLISEPWASELHLAGRLDRATTGLLILTNDGAFSESLTEPGAIVPKTYLVTTDLPISDEIVANFETGMRFEKEAITTQPAIVEQLAPCETRLTIYEGKHHQIKRMFARFEIRVTALHRESIGDYQLRDDFLPGEYRTFTPDACEEK